MINDYIWLYTIYSITIYVSYDYILNIQYNDVSLFVRNPMLQKNSHHWRFRPRCGSRGTNEPLGTTCQGVAGAVATGAMRKFGWQIFTNLLYTGLGTPQNCWPICKGYFSSGNMPEHSGLGMIAVLVSWCWLGWLRKMGETNRVQKCLEKWVQCWNGGFLKWWYPTTIGFPTTNDPFGGVLGVPLCKETPKWKRTSKSKFSMIFQARGVAREGSSYMFCEVRMVLVHW